MIELLFADRADATAFENLPAREREDAWTFVLGEYQPGESELRLHTLRDAFFEAYDALVRLLNERLLAPTGTTSPPSGTSTLATVADPPAVPDTAGPQPRVGRGLPRYERELPEAYDQLRSAGIGVPDSDAYLSGATAVQHFEAAEEPGPGWVLSLRNDRAIAVSAPFWSALVEEPGPGWVLSLRNDRAIAVSAPFWSALVEEPGPGWVLSLRNDRAIAVSAPFRSALVRAGRPAADGDPLNAVGYPTAPGTEPTVLDPDVQRVALEGGGWGKGWLVRFDNGWRWEPQVDLSFNQTGPATNWPGPQPPQLRLRALITLPWDTAEELEVTPARRRDLKAQLPVSRLDGAVTTLSLRRGADLRAANWDLGSNRNANASVSYSATIASPDGRPALTGAVMTALPGTLQSSTVTCAEVTIQDAAAWAAVLPPGASTKLTLEEVTSILLAAWETAAEVLPAVACDATTMRWAGPPTVELRVSAEGPHDQPRANLDTLIDLGEVGPTDRNSLPEMAVTITVSPTLEDTERRKVLRRALVRMLRGFGYFEADEHLFT
ncbi:hypothetical protein [Streptomyces sp. NBC_00989]|uniref:hypothetical protein n=1 Tax=Streptomyces sp. NBC_00989 TaxID=2903705 RepID=UPI003864E0E0|nr:hypothetical protein OG714_52165 [Streptomyces sp. NBC_00989]